MSAYRRRLSFLLLLTAGAAVALAAGQQQQPPSVDVAAAPRGGDNLHLGGESDGIVQVGKLVYSRTKSSHCFADPFLVRAQKDSAISTSRRFHAVKLGSEELFGF